MNEVEENKKIDEYEIQDDRNFSESGDEIINTSANPRNDPTIESLSEEVETLKHAVVEALGLIQAQNKRIKALESKQSEDSAMDYIIKRLDEQKRIADRAGRGLSDWDQRDQARQDYARRTIRDPYGNNYGNGTVHEPPSDWQKYRT